MKKIHKHRSTKLRAIKFETFVNFVCFVVSNQNDIRRNF